MKKKEEKQPEKIQICLNQTLQTLWVDGLNVSSRHDDMVFFRFVANQPDGITEQARFMTNKKSLMRMLDGFCKSVNYYPLPPQSPSEKADEKSKVNQEKK